MRRPLRPVAPTVLGLVGLLGLVCLFLLQVVPVRHGIENDLLGRSTIALNEAGLPGARVELTGRDAEISGVPEQEATRAADAVRAVRGVRAARVQPAGRTTARTTASKTSRTTAPMTAGPTDPARISPAPAGQPSDQRAVSLTFAEGTVTVSGWVGSEQQRAELLNRLGAVKRWTVRDRMLIDPALAAATYPSAHRLVAVARTVRRPGDGLIVRYAGGDGIVRGRVASARAESAVLDAVRASIPAGGATEDHVDVGPRRARP